MYVVSKSRSFLKKVREMAMRTGKELKNNLPNLKSPLFREQPFVVVSETVVNIIHCQCHSIPQCTTIIIQDCTTNDVCSTTV